MVNPSPGTFWTQANALLRKNLTFQKRNVKTNIRLILFPVILCLLLFLLQRLIDSQLEKASKDAANAGTGIIPNPPEWPPLLQLPDEPPSCRRRTATPTCSFTLLFTADNHSFAQSVSDNLFPTAFTENHSDDDDDIMATLATIVLGTGTLPEQTNLNEPAFSSGLLYYLQTQCPRGAGVSLPFQDRDLQIGCARGLYLWRNSSSAINSELYKIDETDNPEPKGQISEIFSAFDFLNSNGNRFNVTIWYNPTGNNGTGSSAIRLVRIPRSVNLISNAYLQFLRGPNTKMLFEFVKEMPISAAPNFRIDIASILGCLFFTWVVLQLFPVALTSLVYEKQQKLRIMMKMHGLGDGPYWMISYGYFLAISVIYMLCFVLFGSVLVTAYIGVFGTGLLAGSLFNSFLQSSFPRRWIIFMELYPGFALYRGLFEFSEYASGITPGTDGMRWQDLSDSANGMKEVLNIMFAEWIVLLFAAYYIDQVLSSGKSPLFFLKGYQKKPLSSLRKPSIQRQGSKVLAQMEKPDVIQEREKVEQLLLEPTINHAIVCDDLKKIYPGRDGNPGKFAVRGLSLAVPRGECFGMLGPNGAGKTSFISMMIGLTKPTSGTAFVQGQDIRTQMDRIYTSMGVCPQHDLLWESLTGREHLLFYGRLKNLKGSVLTQAVEESLKSLNLFHGGVADKQAGKYSGGMKRRLSVAISLIGDPKVVYMDEPSTGLDPASRKCLWNVVKLAKRDRAIILTTHSMEEAEALCDRLGIFVDGSLQCVGNPKELKGRYGGTYVLTMTTSSGHEKDVENMVQQLSPNANKIYHLSGTQKFELPKEEVKIADVFRAIDAAKRNFTVFAWGLADTTLEDVFIKVARGAQAFDTLS